MNHLFRSPHRYRTAFFVATVIALSACDDSKNSRITPETASASKPVTPASGTASSTPGLDGGSITPDDAAAPRLDGSREATASTTTTAEPTAKASRSTRSRTRTKKRRPTGKIKPKPKPTSSTTATLSNPPTGPSASNTTSKPEPTATPAPLAPAEPGSADATAEQVDKIYRPLKNFKARFNQKYRAKIAGKTKESAGVLLVHRPNQLSFRYDPPNANRAVSDGKTLKVYEAENKQLFTQPVAKTEYPGALAFIMGKGLRRSFTFTFHKKAKFKGGIVLVGKPRVANPAYKGVIFYIDKKLLEKGDLRAIRRVLVIDAQGNRNRFDFTDISEPQKIDPGEFKFEPPPGTNVVKR
jgi:outer membrane lipoprotein-sorting protein